MGYKRKRVDPPEPIGVSPAAASQLTSVSRSIIFDWIKREEIESVLINGRRIINFQSLKRKIAPDKVRQVRRGIWNPSNAQETESSPRRRG